MLRPLSSFLWCLATVLLLLSTVVASAFDYRSVRGRSPRPETIQRIEAESMYYPQPARLQHIGKRLPEWSNRTQVLWDGLLGEQMDLVFRIDQAGDYRLAIKLTSGLDYAKIDIALNGETIATDIDTYSNVTELMTLLQLGERQLSAGNHRLALQVVGINPKVKEVNDPDTYLIGVDYLELGRLGARPKPAVTHRVASESKAPTETTALSFHDMRAVMSEHCYHCHNAEKQKGDLDLQSLDSIEAYLADIELTRMVSESIEYGEMPPEKEPAIPAARRQQMLATTETWIDQYLAGEARLPVVTMRRLNRYEYNNAVKDLFHLRGDIYPLPEKAIRSDIPYFDPASGKFPDSLKLGNRPLGKRQVEEPFLTRVVPYSVDLQAEHGFNNYGDELSLSPILMEAFLKLSHSVLNAPEFADYSKSYDSLFAPPSGDSSDPTAIGRERIHEFLYRAFRSDPGESAERFSRFFEAQLAAGTDFTTAMRSTISGILASPRFLYLVEEQAEDKELPLSGYELASRLSFFLWSTIPDAELLASVESGALLTDAGLRQQVTRMLESPRSQSLSHNFARQWLRLDGLINAIPDYERFTHYYSRFGCEQFKFGLHAMAEPLLLFESIMVEDRSIMLLVDSDYAWRTDSMDTWYGTPSTPFTGRGENRFETYQSVYHRRRLNTRREGGVMTTAAMLTMTSDPLRTNPINRGAWTLTVMFNQPPPPPPDVVPEIEADDAAIEAQGLTLRQRLKEHQENESCASCHSKIDPLGFAFENYDAVGRWRDSYSSGLPIDASGDLFGGDEFTDVVGFKDAMLARPELFIRGFCEHMLSYALGRQLSVADRPAVDEIVAAVMADRGQFTTVIHEIVRSYPFQHKSQYRPQHSGIEQH